MRRFLLLLLLAAPVVASADVVSVRLEEPVDTAALRGGSTAVIAWSADSLGPGVREWEAFLSVDGGQYYGARITPHLDISIRRFRWSVPNVDTHNARILLRFGDEHHETEVDLPLRLSIQLSPAILQFGTTRRAETGEAARPGDPGVALWVESDRHGGHLVPLESASDAMRPASLDAPSEQETTESAAPYSLPFDLSVIALIGARNAPPKHIPLLPPADPLLQSCRLNI